MTGNKDVRQQLGELSSEELASVLQDVISKRPDLSTILLNSCKDTLSSHEATSIAAGTPSLSECLHQASTIDLLDLPGVGLRQLLSRREEGVLRIPKHWSFIFLGVFNVILIITVAASYYMSIGAGIVTPTNFYISQSIDTGWSHRIGALGITIAFISFLFVMYTRYIAVLDLLPTVASPSIAKWIRRLNRVALIAEMFAAFGAIGVGSFNISFNYGVHMAFAFDTFATAVFSIFVQSWIDTLLCKFQCPGSPVLTRRWRACRHVQCVVALLGLIGMFAAGSWGYIAYSSLSELVMSFALFSYYSSWLMSSGTGYIVGVELHVLRDP
jgi:hypothetical protein